MALQRTLLYVLVEAYVLNVLDTDSHVPADRQALPELRHLEAVDLKVEPDDAWELDLATAADHCCWPTN